MTKSNGEFASGLVKNKYHIHVSVSKNFKNWEKLYSSIKGVWSYLSLAQTKLSKFKLKVKLKNSGKINKWFWCGNEILGKVCAGATLDLMCFTLIFKAM